MTLDFWPRKAPMISSVCLLSDARDMAGLGSSMGVVNGLSLNHSSVWMLSDFDVVAGGGSSSRAAGGICRS